MLCTIGSSHYYSREASRGWTGDPGSGPSGPNDSAGTDGGDRTIVKERVVERRREGEVYVGGFGGFTWGHDYDNAEGTGSLKGAPIGSFGLANSVVYGAKIGYFHPGRLNSYQRGFRVARVSLASHDAGFECDRPHKTRLQEQ